MAGTKNYGRRGFGSMTPERRYEIASLGGLAVAKDHEHMKEIARKGGLAAQKNRREKEASR